MGVRWRHIQSLADKLLVRNQIAAPSVPVDTIAECLNVRIIYQEYEEDGISGFFYNSPKEPLIGVNKQHAVTRARFTIAHELGHFLLHSYTSGNVHVDRSFKIKLRSEESSQGTNTEEIEANTFAAELLMPLKFLKSDLAATDAFDFEDDRLLKKLAGQYRVSPQAMYFRLARLGYISF